MLWELEALIMNAKRVTTPDSHNFKLWLLFAFLAYLVINHFVSRQK